MKRKILSILLSLLLLFTCAFSTALFSSCKVDPLPGNEDEILDDGDENGDDQTGDNNGNNQTPPVETPDGTLPPSDNSDWGMGEMPV